MTVSTSISFDTENEAILRDRNTEYSYDAE